MKDFNEYTRENLGKQVLVSTTSGQFGGILTGSKTDDAGNITALVLQQYLHRTEVPTEEILNVRLV